ncbi:hypothetical protein EV2_012305 [Malus domestica]
MGFLSPLTQSTTTRWISPDRSRANLPEIIGVEDRDALLILHEPENNHLHALEIEQPPAVVGERQHQEVVDGHVLQDGQDPPLELGLARVRCLDESSRSEKAAEEVDRYSSFLSR